MTNSTDVATRLRADGWVLIKRGLYWRPLGLGYTAFLEEAGIYSDADAASHEQHSAGGVSTTKMRASEAPELSPACPADAASRFYERKYREAADLIEKLIAALEFYADPDTYVAIGFFPDSPCGEFIEDFGDHGGDYDRPMPGLRARTALQEVQK